MNLLEEFQNFLRENLPHTASFHPHYNEMLEAMLLAGGKHFRAMLLLGVVEAVRPELTQKAMRVALAVELMHTYSLIHDDLPAMDNSPLRRGVPTLHIRYDETSAILAGDALNTHAFYEISKAQFEPNVLIKCVEILSSNAGVSGMVLGQALDCYFENQKLDLEQLKFLHLHKTGKLIAASLELGALLSGKSEQKCKQIYGIGLDLGLAFQIQDDIIDATKSANEAGKPTSNDSAKNSFTNLLGIQGAKLAKDELIIKIQSELKDFDDKVSQMVVSLTDKHLR